MFFHSLLLTVGRKCTSPYQAVHGTACSFPVVAGGQMSEWKEKVLKLKVAHPLPFLAQARACCCGAVVSMSAYKLGDPSSNLLSDVSHALSTSFTS